MQRWVTTFVGLAVVALAVWIVAHNFHPPKAIGHDPHPPALGGADGGATLAATGGTAASAQPSFFEGDAGPLLLDDLLGGPRMDAGVGATMLDGTAVPPLPLTVPRSVRFGVVLVSYAGAQPSAGGGARPATRSKTDALALARKLLATAQTDFHAAVQQGD
ncbi:MAG TPA: hypothetical protein VIY73_03785, partial [Polyangiaceae bacterium]